MIFSWRLTIEFAAMLGLLAYQEPVTYLDRDYPGSIPELYAEGIINVAGRLQQNLTMTTDGKEHYITQTDKALWRYERLLRLKTMGNGDVVLDTPQFVREFEYKNEWFIGEPMVSPDDQSLFFVADYPPDLWRSKRTANGDWSSPEKLDLSTPEADWYVTFASGDLYFTNGTMYQGKREEGAYKNLQKVNGVFNDSDVRDPVMAPNGDYVIFSRLPDDSTAKADLYITFAEGTEWSAPVRLDDTINTEAFEFAPYISPDGRFLFFSRRDQWEQATFSNVYWVSLEIIEAYRGLANE